ncbi:MAG: vitamin K epoxide reductase family protein [Chloroflexi bacterium]|nr:vitamin K epoxide reductase family protein [Chloroflexota bacterium]
MNRKIMTIIALSVVGLGISIYLLMVHWAIIGKAVCFGLGECEKVNASSYAELLGIPVALLGGLTYITFFALCVAVARGWVEEYTRLALFFVAVIGFAFSLYLTYIEVAVLEQICPWCVLSAIIITIITVLSFVELREWQSG